MKGGENDDGIVGGNCGNVINTLRYDLQYGIAIFTILTFFKNKSKINAADYMKGVRTVKTTDNEQS